MNLRSDPSLRSPRSARPVSRLALALAALAMCTASLAAPFTPGNVVIYRVGTGTGSLVNTGNAVFLDEYTTGGTLVQSVPLPTTVNGSQRAFFASGTASSEGEISRSADGQYLIATGYATTFASSLANTTATQVNRVVARIDVSGNIDTSTALTDFASTNNPRSAASVDGSSFWVAGGAGGVRYVMNVGATASTDLTSTAASGSFANVRQLGIFNNQLYSSSGAGTNTFKGVETIGSGLPTSGAQTVTRFPVLTDTTNPSTYAFYLADLTGTVPGFDTLYAVDDTSSTAGGILKFSLVGTNWVSNGTLDGTGTSYRGLAATVSGTTVTLYAVRKGGTGATGGGELVKLVDASGYNGALTGVPTLLATAAANTAYRGVALSPQNAVVPQPDLTVSVTGPGGALVNMPFGYTLTVANPGTAAASNVRVDFTLPPGVSYVSATGAGGFLPGLPMGGVISFTGGSLASGASSMLTVTVSAAAPSTVVLPAGAAVADPANAISESNEGNNSSPASVTTVVIASQPPTIVVDPSTTSFLNAASGYTSGALSDPTDPAATLGINLTIADPDTPVPSLVVTAASSNPAVVPNDAIHVVLSGSGSSRNLLIIPTGVGYADITLTVADGTGSSGSTVIHHAVSGASATPSLTQFVTGASDGSTAIPVDSQYTWVGDDEDQVIRLHSRSASGWPQNSVNFTPTNGAGDPPLGLTDISGGIPREVDIEASTRVGNRLFWMGSQSNSPSGNLRPNRDRVFATDASGSGAGSTLTFVGRYDFLREDLIAWDVNNVHGKGANYYGLAASAANGVQPKQLSGYNIEGLSMAPGSSTTAYVAFRAPLVPPPGRVLALIVPVLNFPTLAISGGPQGSAVFGSPIDLDLGGRGIRSIEGDASGMLIIAGPAADTVVPPIDFKLFTWTGNPMDLPVMRTADLTGLTPEGVVELPLGGLLPTSQIQLVSDLGAAVLYGDGTATKDLPHPEWKKSRIDTVVLGDPVCNTGFFYENGACHPDLCYNVTCAPSDPCHSAGVCSPMTGQCSNPAVPIPEVTGLLVDDAVNTLISWTPIGGAAAYDVATGQLSQLAVDGGTLSAACYASPVPIAGVTDAGPIPAPNTGRYYMVRVRYACGTGSYGSDSNGLPRVAPGACP
jgi:uncharacterized repeat protein (TIGR01451 family)